MVYNKAWMRDEHAGCMEDALLPPPFPQGVARQDEVVEETGENVRSNVSLTRRWAQGGY